MEEYESLGDLKIDAEAEQLADGVFALKQGNSAPDDQPADTPATESGKNPDKPDAASEDTPEKPDAAPENHPDKPDAASEDKPEKPDAAPVHQPEESPEPSL